MANGLSNRRDAYVIGGSDDLAIPERDAKELTLVVVTSRIIRCTLVAVNGGVRGETYAVIVLRRGGQDIGNVEPGVGRI